MYGTQLFFLTSGDETEGAFCLWDALFPVPSFHHLSIRKEIKDKLGPPTSPRHGQSKKMTDIIDLSILSQDDYRRIHAASSKDLKKQTLLTALCIHHIDEEDELLKSILIDYCLEAMMFASNQGFAWEKVDKAAKFALSLLQETCFKGVDDNTCS